LGWLLSTTLALTVVYTLSITYQTDYVYDVVGSAFYAGFHRLAWSAVLMWIIFACVNKYGGICTTYDIKNTQRELVCKFILNKTYFNFITHFIFPFFFFFSLYYLSTILTN
jgi:hypothetical protein